MVYFFNSKLYVARGRFHKPIYALPQALTLCAKLLLLKKASQKLGAERKSLVQSVNGFYEIDPGSGQKNGML